MKHGTLRIDGASIRYWILHPEKRDTVVLLHGIRGTHEALLDIAEHFSEYRVVLFDLPGHGQSTAMHSAHTIQHLVGLITAVIKKLGQGNIHLWGHSFGALLAIAYAAQHSTKLTSVTIVSPAIPGRGLVFDLGSLYWNFLAASPHIIKGRIASSAIIDRLSAEQMIKNASPDLKEKLILDGKKRLHQINPDVCVEMYQSYVKYMFLKQAKKIKAPTLLLGGDLDDLAPVIVLENLSLLILNSRVHIIEGYGHLVPLENPDEVGRISVDFVDSMNL